MDNEGFATPWLEFEEEFGERMLMKPPISQMTKDAERWGAIMVSKYTIPAPDPLVKTEERTTDDGLKVRIYTPEGYKGGKPVCLYYHGGGWCMGNLDIDDPFCRAISRSGGLVVVSIDYRLGPQNEHHVIKGDCYRGLRWALDNAKELNTTNGFICAGVSAGGNLAFSTALKAIDDGLQNQLVGLLALLPATIHPHSVPEELRPSYTAMEEHDQHTANTKSTMMAFWEAYGAPPDDPYASPLLHPRLGDLKNVYMAIAGHDTLADDGLLMKQRLEQHRVPNRCDLYQGLPHFFFGYPSPKLDKPRTRFYDNLSLGIQFVLS